MGQEKQMSNIDATRVMGAAGAPAAGGDRTLVVPGGMGGGATMQMPSGGDAFRTQMGGTTTCPVCKSTTPVMDSYCGDCGFLLTSTPAEDLALPAEEKPVAELVDPQDGRRYRLRVGVNTVGRQGADVLTSEGTVSRMHAKITIDENGGITVEDLGSSNGTKVGDTRIGANQPVAAAPGTPLRFGNWRLNLEAGGGAGAGSGDATIVVSTGDRTIVEAPPASDRTIVGAPPAEVPVAEAAPDPVMTAATVALLKKLDGLAPDIPLEEGTLTVGRKAGNTLVYPDPYLSGKHAEIGTDATGSYLTDVGSSNGTFVNGQRLTPNERQLLLDGDEIQLGQTRYRFETVTPVAPAESLSDAPGTASPGENAVPESAGTTESATEAEKPQA